MSFSGLMVCFGIALLLVMGKWEGTIYQDQHIIMPYASAVQAFVYAWCGWVIK